MLVILQFPEPSAVTVPSTVVPLVSYKVTVQPGSAVPVIVGVVVFVVLSVVLLAREPLAKSGVLGAFGAMVSTDTSIPADAAPVLPAASMALTVRVWLPSLKVEEVMLQLPEPSAVAVPRTVVPSVS